METSWVNVKRSDGEGVARVVVVDLGSEEFEYALRGLRRRSEQPGRKHGGGGGY